MSSVNGINFDAVFCFEIENLENRSHLDYKTKADTEIKEGIFFKAMSIPGILYKKMMGK